MYGFKSSIFIDSYKFLQHKEFIIRRLKKKGEAFSIYSFYLKKTSQLSITKTIEQIDQASYWNLSDEHGIANEML